MTKEEIDLHNKIKAVDAWYWAQHSGIILQGGAVFSTKGHKYQEGIMQCDHPRQVFRKGAQMGVTEIMVLKILHNQIYGMYNKGALYLFPTEGDVSDFSKARFKTLITDNHCIGKFIKNTDSTNIKQINKSMLYLRGARPSATKIQGSKKSSSALKGIPVDAIIYDEFDEMDPEMIALADERVSHSEIQHQYGAGHKFCVGTPTVPDHGTDHEYSLSNQQMFFIKCDKCNEYTCAEEEFPECIRVDDSGRGYKCCKKCGAEIFSHNGEWVAKYKEVENYVGWWISQLNSNYIDPGHILKLYENPPNGNVGEVYNSKLGMAYIEAENRLTQQDVLSCCTLDLMATQSKDACAMGVDVGKTLHYVIGHNMGGSQRKIIKVGKCTEFSDLLELERRYNVKCTVIDANPDMHAARQHTRDSRAATYLCTYSESQGGSISFQDHDNRVLCNRNEILDRTHNLVVDLGRLTLPRASSEIEEYAKQMTMICKTYVEDNITKALKPRYVKVGGAGADDHYRHATNYFEMACEKVTYHKLNNYQGSNFSRSRDHDRSYAVTD